MSLRTWTLLTQAHRRNEEAQWRRSLAIVNTVTGIVGGDQVTLDDLKGRGTAEERDHEQLEAFYYRTDDWASCHVTDPDAPEM